MSEDFWTGFLVGFVSAGVVGFIAQQFLFWIGKIRQSGKPQRVYLETADTPRRVVWNSILAGCGVVVLVVIVLGLGWLLLVSLE